MDDQEKHYADLELAFAPSEVLEHFRKRLVLSSPLSVEGDVLILGGGRFRRFRDGEWGEVEFDWRSKPCA